MHFYPVNLNLSGREVLFIADDSRLSKESLEAKLKEVELAGAKVKYTGTKDYEPSQLKGVWLVITTADSAFNARVLADAQSAQVWVNAVDDPENCSVILPARLRQGSLLVTVSTGGLSPAFSSWLKNQLKDFVSSDQEQFLKAVANVRNEIQKTGESTESFNWQTALDLAVTKGILELVQEGKIKEAEELIRECLSLS